MRIISGKFRGKIIDAPHSLPVRPTTDFAKTGLFNILRNRYDFSEVSFLDLFCGTGNISFEMISEGVASVVSVDAHAGCISFVNMIFAELNFTNGKAVKSDVFKYLKNVNSKFDIIFADPPYELQEMDQLPALIMNNNLLTESGVFILEHQAKKDFTGLPYFLENRVYGNAAFTFFGRKNDS